MLEVDSLEVKVLWTVIMVVLYCMLPGAYAVSIDQVIYQLKWFWTRSLLPQ